MRRRLEGLKIGLDYFEPFCRITLIAGFQQPLRNSRFDSEISERAQHFCWFFPLWTKLCVLPSKRYWGGGLRFTDYIFKVIDLPDDRLPGRRMSMSRSMTQGAQDFYEYAAFGEKAQDRPRTSRGVKVVIA